MVTDRLKGAAAIVLALGLAGAGGDDQDLPPPIPTEKFPSYFEMVKPSREEFRWRDEIAWAGTIHEARERASREDKPILAWQAANSPPLGST